MTLLAAGLSSLLQVVGVSLVAGVGVTVVFSLAIVGAVHSRESRRMRRRGPEIAWGVLSTLAIVGVLAAIAAGLLVLAV